MKSFFIIVMLMLFSIPSLFISEAYAYLDPGSGTIFIQVILGVLVGVGITLKIYWYKVKEKILRIRKKNE